MKDRILDALSAFAESRPGIEPGNYGHGPDGWRAYRSESRAVTGDLHDARELLRAVRLSHVTEGELLAAFSAFTGRLTCKIAETPQGNIKVSLEYCTGQYYPTEYRRAVCAVLASALWAHYCEEFAGSARPNRKACRSKVCTCHDGTAWITGQTYQEGCGGCGCVWESNGSAIRRRFRAIFGARLQKRWFD